MSDERKFLEVRNLTVEYATGGKTVHAVSDISFSLEAGHSLGLVGETGAGKTTIAKAILGILPELQAHVRAGEILLNGQNLLELPEQRMLSIRGGEIAMIFQDPMTALNPVKRVGDQIAEAVRLHNRVTKGQAKARACEMLEMVGIPRIRYSEYPHQFSGGMKQRVVIAMALACNPHLLLADEPTTALDVTIQAQVLQMMGDLQRKLGTSTILITHDLGVVSQTCDRVAVMYAGEIVESGTAEDIFLGKVHHPYTEGLFGSLPDLNRETRRLSPIDGLMPDPADLPKGCKFNPRCPHCTEECRSCEPELIDQNGHAIRCHRINKEENA